MNGTKKIPLMYEDFVYIPILKNASTTYNHFFREMGWIEVTMHKILENKNLKLFSYIQNPDIRHTKAICQWLITNDGLDYLDNRKHRKLMCIVCSTILDTHSLPIAITHFDILDRINWIPLDFNLINSNELTNLFFKENNLDFKINDSYNRHLGTEKIEFYKKINKIKENFIDNTAKKHLEDLLHIDTKLWKNTIKYYEEKYKG
jgi:hypothetical protein